MSILDINFNSLDDSAKQLLKAELFRNKFNYLKVAIKSTKEKYIYNIITVTPLRDERHGESDYYMAYTINPSMVISIRTVSFEQAKREFNLPLLRDYDIVYDIFRIAICSDTPGKFIYLDLLSAVPHSAGQIGCVELFYINIVDIKVPI